MYDVAVNMIVRNGEDSIAACLETILPRVKKAIVLIDDTSTDSTSAIVHRLSKKWDNLEVKWYPVREPLIDVVAMRNAALELIKEKWVWIVDSDEYYPEDTVWQIALADDCDVYTFQCWAVWNKQKAHCSSSKPRIPRIFRNDGRRWEGKFGKERLVRPTDRIKDLPLRYIHLTHVKNETWRKEFRMERVADGKHLIPMPLEAVKTVKQLYASMPNLRER